MDAAQTASTESSTVKALPEEKPLESAKVEAPPSSPDQSEIRPEVSYVIPGELLRAVLDQKAKPAWWRAILNSQFMLALLPLIGALIGAWFTNYLADKQKDSEYQRTVQLQELARVQSRTDEENRMRVQKVGEVWERLDADEFTIDQIIQNSMLERENQSPELKRKRFLDITKMLEDDQAFVSRYRYWLGEEFFKTTNDYLNVNIRLARNQLFSAPNTDLSELIQKRKDAKQDILKIRSLLEEKSKSQSTTTPTK
ncbi:MAG TPA: hypothetical protein VFS77_09240 [Pyrinomonadaceae bacterium]|nr:hypothetical protein [Pyrinomonadaceae bacterium]